MTRPRGATALMVPIVLGAATVLVAVFVPVRHVLEPNFHGGDCAQPVGPNPPFECYSPHTHWFILARLAIVVVGLGTAWLAAKRSAARTG